MKELSYEYDDLEAIAVFEISSKTFWHVHMLIKSYSVAKVRKKDEKRGKKGAEIGKDCAFLHLFCNF